MGYRIHAVTLTGIADPAPLLIFSPYIRLFLFYKSQPAQIVILPAASLIMARNVPIGNQLGAHRHAGRRGDYHAPAEVQIHRLLGPESSGEQTVREEHGSYVDNNGRFRQFDGALAHRNRLASF